MMWLFSSSVLLVQSCPTLQAMDCSPPGSSVHGIFWQEYWSGLLFPSPGDLPDPGMEVGFPALRQILYRLSYLGSPKCDFSSDVTAKENYMEVPQKITELPNNPAISLLGRNIQNFDLKEVSTHQCHCSIIHKSQKLKPAQISINK